MFLDDALVQMEMMAEDMVSEAHVIQAAYAGLDERCGVLRVGDDFIAVRTDNDRRLQYYGGFEYVRADHRHVIGSWVFYSIESSRVDEAFNEARDYINNLEMTHVG